MGFSFWNPIARLHFAVRIDKVRSGSLAANDFRRIH